MNKSAVPLTLAAAALIAVSASPALAVSKTRSGAALPSKTISASRITSRLSTPARLTAPSRITVQAARAPSRDRPSFGNGNFGGNFGGGLATLFRILPPRIQQIIANALGNAGPGAGDLCELLGIPECQLPDSNG